MLKIPGAALAFVLSCEPAVACSVPYIRTFAGHTVAGAMTVKSGKPCSIALRHSRGPMHGATIVQQSNSGAASVGSAGRIVYRSRAGYAGQDSFTYSRQGRDTQDRSVVRTVRMQVTVIP
jgi:hypothetical protein